jgi:O-antigen ligase
MVFCIAIGFAASVAYDTVLVKTNERLSQPIALLVIGSLGLSFLLAKYPLSGLHTLVINTWPLHLFTVSFVLVCVGFHDRSRLDQVIIYTLVAYATYALLPLVILNDARLFGTFARLVAISSGLLAVPSLFGALGFQSLAGIPLRVKQHYAAFSGIAASGGIFEHPEGHALQMAAGMIACIYVISRSGGLIYYLSFSLALMGLIISQGRAAMLGLLVALAFVLLPELFRRSRLFFLGSLTALLIIPFLIWTQFSDVPVVGSYLRVERGLSGRVEAWQFAISLVEEKPWTGHGFLASSELTELHKKLLRKSGFSGAGTTFHNTFISKSVDLGIIVACTYALLYLVPLFRICQPSRYPREQQFVRSMVLLCLTTALFRDYNIGGVRSTTILGAVFLGMANLWPLVANWERKPISPRHSHRHLTKPTKQLTVGSAK